MVDQLSTTRVRWMLTVFLVIFTPIIILADAAKFDPLGLLAWTIAPPAITIQDNVGYLPLPPLALLLKANVTTEAATGKVTIQYGDIRFICKPGSTIATVSDGEHQQEIVLPGPPCVNAGIIYLPIRSLLHAFEIEESIEHGWYQFKLPGIDTPMKMDSHVALKPIAQFRDLGNEIYIINADGTGLMRLSYDCQPESNVLPYLFPDGKAIINHNGMANSLETGEEWRVFGEDGRDNSFHTFRFSADGKRIIAGHNSEEGKSFVVIANIDGTEQRVVTDGTCTALSPDGKFLTFYRDKTNLFLYDLEQDQEIALGNLNSAIFSPTEPVLLVTQSQKIDYTNKRYFLFAYTYAGPEKGKIAKLPDGYFANNIIPYAQFSPDGKQIVISEMQGCGILLATADLKQVVPLTRTPDKYQSPVFTPDGEHIVFHFDSFLYVMDNDGKNPKRLSLEYVDKNPGSPAFLVLTDGRILFYATTRRKDHPVPRPLR